MCFLNNLILGIIINGIITNVVNGSRINQLLIIMNIVSELLIMINIVSDDRNRSSRIIVNNASKFCGSMKPLLLFILAKMLLT